MLRVDERGVGGSTGRETIAAATTSTFADDARAAELFEKACSAGVAQACYARGKQHLRDILSAKVPPDAAGHCAADSLYLALAAVTASPE